MKTIAILVIAALIGSSFQQDNTDHLKFIEKLRQTSEECIKETGVDQALTIKAFLQGEFTDDNKLKCFYKCLYQKLGCMDASGKIDLSGITDHMPPNVDKAKLNESITKCNQLKADDTCQLAFDVAKCMREAWQQLHSN
ncbi:hypothetical protein ILUMI_22986 [Ignelater luminosus]|uniref:Uncharacterized protein n=1 Tax=Ignelater luminosus TaxID=2038154 RepID=A0A8K0G231_IGNLU|nr:hypothetical protein ILUMI_22986 [Ignelater luminosus]